MLRWIPYPFVRIALFFFLGTILAISWPEMLSAAMAQRLFALFGLVFVLLAICRQRTNLNPGFFGLLAVLAAGYANVQRHGNAGKADLLSAKSPITFYKAIITALPDDRGTSWRMEATMVDARIGNEWRPFAGGVLLYAPKRDFALPFQYGDVLLIKGAPQAISPPLNPGVFDYQRFLANRHIHYQHFTRGEDVRFVLSDPPNMLDHYAFATRSWAEGILNRTISGDRERAMAAALILGVRDGVDDELLRAYAATGAMHVLAVSGLHVGILFWIIWTICRPLRKTMTGRWVAALVAVVILWMYAFVTGMSPSVLRAVTMCSFIAIAQPWNQRINIYNILGVSFFCSLLIDPFQVMSVGFQLSYLAVTGIIIIQPMLYNLWEPRHSSLDQVWKISTVSVAAQLATFALSIFYFHQFPNYFLLSNLFVIPGAFAIVTLGLLTISVSCFAALASFLGWLLEWIIWGLNSIIFAIEKLPFSHVENLYITAFQCCLLIAFLVCCILCFKAKSIAYLIPASAICVIFSVSLWVHFVTAVAAPTLTVYQIHGHTAIDFIRDGRTHFFADTALAANPRTIEFNILPNRRMHGVRKVMGCDSILRQFRGCSVLIWEGKTILRVHAKKYAIPQNLEPDLIVLSNNAVTSLSSLMGKVVPREVLLDSSNSLECAAGILSESRRLKIAVYSVPHQGSFTLNS